MQLQAKTEESGLGIGVMTLHGSKGLEFEKVYIMYVNEGNIPSAKRGQVLSQEALEEERRLFYVGMTRAKKTLDIRYVNQTQESPRSPSRFLKELQD
jgi:DNA helicase-2/ATP-dependent DNA helicase PcrA